MEPLLNRASHRMLFRDAVIILVVGLQLWLLLSPRSGPPTYRRFESLAAYRAWKSNPSEATKAVYDDEMRRARHHDAVILVTTLGSCLVVNVVLFYALWRVGLFKVNGPTKPLHSTPG